MLLPSHQETVQADSGANSCIHTNINEIIQYQSIKTTILDYEGQQCTAEGIGVSVIRFPGTDHIISCYSSYYSPKEPNIIIGLSAIKHNL